MLAQLAPSSEVLAGEVEEGLATASPQQGWLHPAPWSRTGRIHVWVRASPREDTRVRSRGQRKPGLCWEATMRT